MSSIMSYRDRLKYWATPCGYLEERVRLLPTQNWAVVDRFHRYSDADGHYQFLRRTMPKVEFKIVFEVSED
jgi:hypothetical protein